jgi:hypothetical protein
MIDLDRLRSSIAADYLLQATPTDTGPVTRLFHQALSDELLAHRPDCRGDERQLLDALISEIAAVGGWARAGDYPRQHAADHAAPAGALAGLLEDPHYLVVADFTRLVPLLFEGGHS